MQMTEPADYRQSTEPKRVFERKQPLRASVSQRVFAAVVAIVCLSVLSMGAWLSPNSDGHGTHTQLGLKPCMWAITLDQPCMTCGMTTSFAHAGEGRWASSVTTQPMGSLLVVITSVVFWGALVQCLSGARISNMAEPMLRPKVFMLLGLMLLGAWVYKIITW